MVQRYPFLHKINGNDNIFVLNFAKSNNLKVDGCKNGGGKLQIISKNDGRPK
jgi:hypothetical protein